MRRWWRARGLAVRLLGALTVVILTTVTTTFVVAQAVGPALFHEHMLRAGVVDPDALDHAEQAFASAWLVSASVALGVALLVSASVAGLMTRRTARSLATLTDATRRVSTGGAGPTAATAHLGAEFAGLAAELDATAARLADAERLRARLLADVAHELRTPVATIEASLEAVEDGVLPLDATTTALLREQGRRLTRLTDDLRAVTRAESPDLELDLVDTQVDDLLAAAVAAAASRARGAGVVLRAEPSPGLVVRCDTQRMAQVLDNLVANALRHTPAGGHVTLSGQDGPEVVLHVRDDGDGVAAEHLPHLFERFYRTDTARDRDHGGSGIGLAVCRALVVAHGGRIGAASDGPGTGTLLTVALPHATDR